MSDAPHDDEPTRPDDPTYPENDPPVGWPIRQQPKPDPDQPVNDGQPPERGPTSHDAPAPTHGQPQPTSPAGYYPHAGPAGGAILPDHPSAKPALILGIAGVVGAIACVGLFLSPFAWYLGSRALRDIDLNPGTYAGRSQASTGRALGIGGTAMLVTLTLSTALFISMAIGF